MSESIHWSHDVVPSHLGLCVVVWVARGIVITGMKHLNDVGTTAAIAIITYLTFYDNGIMCKWFYNHFLSVMFFFYVIIILLFNFHGYVLF